MDDICIQIVNYKTKKYLLPCLDALFADLEGSKLKYSVAILDNASGDDLSDIPKRYPEQRVEINQNDKNVGFGAGHNILAKHAQAKYLLLLNPDIKIIEPHTIERLLERAKQSKAQVVGPRLINAAGKSQLYDHGELYGLRAWVANNAGHAFWRERKDRAEVAWVSGAVFLIEKSWFDRLGGFDENFFLYAEELDLCLRLRNGGGHVIYDPTITMLHYGSVVAKKSMHQRASNDYFVDKHFHSRWDYPLLKLINKIVN
jgi:GT2 family glycosyltransferase